MSLLAYQFAQNALLAGLIISIVAGLVGRFVVMRNMSFAVHGIAEVGFTGTAAGVFFGIDPVVGLLAGAVLAAIGIGTLGVRLRDRDIAIGSILAFGLGLGVLFLTLYTRYATEAFSVLFGSIISVSRQDVLLLLSLGIAVIVALGAIRRPLTFASVDPEVAEARGIPVRAISVVFLLILAVAVAEAIQVVGVLMVLALLITPAAAAQKLTVRPGTATVLGVAIALLCTLGGVLASLVTLYPASFFVATMSFGIYVVSRVVGPSLTSRRPRAALT
ncbi:MAG TPA: metal ABC transporter permease [Candidatus Dormibacteraeota bacterium]|jgi:zinc/manganese transport system permease protein